MTQELNIMPGEETERRTAAGVKKAVIRPGAGPLPGDGDQVLFHCTVRAGEESGVRFSTLREHGGSGSPMKVVLGHTKMVPGLDQALRSMQPHEVAMLKMEPSAHYAHRECPIAAPDGIPGDEELVVEVSVVRVDAVQVVGAKKSKGPPDLDEYGNEVKEDKDKKPDAMLADSDPSLVTKIVTEEGQGWEQPRAPYEVEVSVKALTAADGKLFFSSGTDSGGSGTAEHVPGALYATLGAGQLPRGLEECVGTMLQGEAATFFVVEYDRTGETDVGTVESADSAAVLLVPMPEGSALVEYKVKLLRIIQVRDVLGDGQVLKRRVKDGQGEFPMDCPLEDCVVSLHYKGLLPGFGNKTFIDTRAENDGKAVEVATGEGRLPEGLETSIRVMLPGETALVTSTAAHAYDAFPRPEGVPEGAKVQWEVELISFERPKRWDGMTFEEIMGEVARLKEQANAVFKRELYKPAANKYEKLVRELKNVHPRNEAETKQWGLVTTSLILNVSACYQKLGEYSKAIEWADKVLESEPFHAKGLFRRGQALMLRGYFDEARADFKQMMSADPSTSEDAAAMLSRVKRLEEEAIEKQKRQFKGLFDKKPGGLSGLEGNSTGTGANKKVATDGSSSDPSLGSGDGGADGGGGGGGGSFHEFEIARRNRSYAQALYTVVFLLGVVFLGMALWKELWSITSGKDL